MAELYALCCPDTGEIRYVGKANNSKSRFAGHVRDSARRDYPVYCWIKSLAAKGKMPALCVLAEVGGQWREQERALIASLRDHGYRLLNVADGGDEPYITKEQRAANGRMASIKRASTPEKKRIYELKRSIGQFLHWCEKNGRTNSPTYLRIQETLKYVALIRPDLLPGKWVAPV